MMRWLIRVCALSVIVGLFAVGAARLMGGRTRNDILLLSYQGTQEWEQYFNLLDRQRGFERSFIPIDWAVDAVFWSPDGTQVAFLGGRDDLVQTQTYIMDIFDGHPTEVSNHYHRTGHYSPALAIGWSPNGDRLVSSGSSVPQDSLPSGEQRIGCNQYGELLLSSINLTTKIMYQHYCISVLLTSAKWTEDEQHLTTLELYEQAGYVTLCRSNRTFDCERIQLYYSDTLREVSPPSWSPDGRYFIYSREYQLYRFDVEQEQLTQLTSSDVQYQNPAWSPDGSRIAVWRNTSATGFYGLVLLDPETLTFQPLYETGNFHQSIPIWSPDSQLISFSPHRWDRYPIPVINMNGEVVQELPNPPNLISVSWRPQP